MMMMRIVPGVCRSSKTACYCALKKLFAARLLELEGEAYPARSSPCSSLSAETTKAWFPKILNPVAACKCIGFSENQIQLSLVFATGMQRGKVSSIPQALPERGQSFNGEAILTARNHCLRLHMLSVHPPTTGCYFFQSSYHFSCPLSLAKRTHYKPPQNLPEFCSLMRWELDQDFPQWVPTVWFLNPYWGA